MPDSDPLIEDRTPETGRQMQRLVAIMARLRDPEAGCPWDIEQDFTTIAPYTIEEAYEVADAIEKNDMTALREELGDLLFQVAFHARMAEEAGHFDFDAVATDLSDKMIRRHPHVFGTRELRDSGAQTDANFVMTGSGGIVEVQGTAEGAPFSQDELLQLHFITMEMRH